MLLQVVLIHVVDIHVLDIFHEVRLLVRRLVLGRGIWLPLYQDGVACTYVNFITKLHIILILCNRLRFPLLFESRLPLPLNRPILLLGVVLVTVLRSLLISHCSIIDIGLKAVLSEVNFIALIFGSGAFATGV